MIVATDIESTGFDERKDHLLEVAFVVVDDDLNERAAMSWIINPLLGTSCCVEDLAMPLVVREMHERSGLLADLNAGKGSKPDSVGLLIKAWLEDTFGRLDDLRQIPMLGSTVSFDRRWLRHHLHEIEALFNHRSIDVSSITECASRWNRPVYAARPKQDKHVPHRALDDARNSIEYLRYYRASGFVQDERNLIEKAAEHVSYFKYKCPFEGCDICGAAFGELKRGEGR